MHFWLIQWWHKCMWHQKPLFYWFIIMISTQKVLVNVLICMALLDLIAQSGLKSNLVDWIVIDNPRSKLDYGFEFSIQFCNFNPNLKYQNQSCSNNEAKLLFTKIFKCHKLVRDVSWEIHSINIKIGHVIFAVLYLWIVIGFKLDCQSILKIWFGLSITYLWWIWIWLTIQKIG